MKGVLRTALVFCVAGAGALAPGAVKGVGSRAAPMTLQVLSPTQPVTIPAGGKISISLRVTGLKMAARELGGPNVPGHGHYHFYVDCIPPNAYFQAILSGCWAGADTSVHPAFDLASSHVRVTSGTHTLLLALARNDHILYRAVPAAIVFTIQTVPMTLRILQPRSAVTVRENGKIPVSLKITGLTMAAGEMGRPNVPGHGHFHFYVDCIPPDAYSTPNLKSCWAGASAAPQTTFDLATSHVRIKPGTHLLIIALAQNDHVLYRVAPVDIIFTVLPRR